ALAGALVAMGVPLALLTVVHQAWVAFVILLVQGAGIVVVDVLVLTLLQRSLRPALIGRVLGVMSSLEVGSTLVGSLLAPLLVSTVNLRAALVVLGLGPAVIALIALPRLRGLARNADRRRRALAPTVELLAGLGVFAGVDRPSLELLAASSVSEHAVAGTTVVREGAPASDFYVVRSGTLDVVSSGEGGTAPVMVNTLGGGDHFGEIGLIEAIPRTASVVARTDSELIRVSGGDLLDVLNRSPAMASTLFDGVAGRLARTHPSYRP